MSNAVLKGHASGTGTVTLETPNTNTDRTISLPDADGAMVVNGANSAIVSGTAVASTSVTSIDFTSIPSWVKRVTVMFNGVSTDGTSIPMIQLGSGSFTTSGYVGSAAIAFNSNAPAVSNMSSGFLVSAAHLASFSFRGSVTINLVGSNIWVSSGVIGQDDSTRISWTSGAVGISGALDRVRITTANGTDTFDAGSINILYE